MHELPRERKREKSPTEGPRHSPFSICSGFWAQMHMYPACLSSLWVWDWNHTISHMGSNCFNHCTTWLTWIIFFFKVFCLILAYLWLSSRFPYTVHFKFYFTVIRKAIWYDLILKFTKTSLWLSMWPIYTKCFLCTWKDYILLLFTDRGILYMPVGPFSLQCCSCFLIFCLVLVIDVSIIIVLVPVSYSVLLMFDLLIWELWC